MSTWRPSGPEPEPRSVRDGLDRWARRMGAPSTAAVSAVFRRWEELVGAGVAEHATPRSLVRGTLVVSVDHPAWATQLRSLSDDLLRRLEEELGTGVVDRLDVRVAGVEGTSRRGRRW